MLHILGLHVLSYSNDFQQSIIPNRRMQGANLLALVGLD